jgi:predicted esterase
MMRLSRTVALLVVCLLACFASTARAQSRPAFFDTPSSVEVVGMVRPQERVPLLVLLPPTGGDARVVMPPPEVMGPYFVLVTPGVPQRSDYDASFARYLEWTEQRVLADIDRALAEHPINPDRIYLAGFSLGGDVAWGLLTRHPERFRGAVVMGSRAGATVRSGTLAMMNTRQMRLAFVMGTLDESQRRRGSQRAREAMERASVACRMLEFPGAHEMPPAELYAEALSFVLERRTP